MSDTELSDKPLDELIDRHDEIREKLNVIDEKYKKLLSELLEIERELTKRETG